MNFSMLNLLKIVSLIQVAEALIGLIYYLPKGENSGVVPCLSLPFSGVPLRAATPHRLLFILASLFILSQARSIWQQIFE